MLSKFSGLLLSIYRRAQESTVQEFQDQALLALKSFIKFDSSSWGTAKMTTHGIDIHSIHLHQSSTEMLMAYEKVKHQDLVVDLMAQQSTSTISFSAGSLFPSNYEEMRQFRSDFGQENALVTSDINPITKFIQWVSLFRADSSQVCTDAELQMLALLGPHLMQALAINRLGHFDRQIGDAARHSWSVAIADRRGFLHHVDTRFNELQRTEWPTSGNSQLPAQWLAKLTSGGDRIVGERVVIERSLEHDVFFLKARERHPVDDLSARELTVARLLVSGLTQKQVALQLERSPETIRTQVRVVFEKLGINNVVLLGPQLALRN